MTYKNFKNKKISALGVGTMRLPTIDNDYSKVDISATKEMIAYAFANGVNYVDTAYGYHNGNAETAVGEVLKEYPRESYFLTDKFPGFNTENLMKVEEIFFEQLKKCQTEYFDFYLFHNVCEANIDNYLNRDFKLMEFMLEQKRLGRIKHIGFSIHGNIDTTKRFLEAYGEHMEFGQVQLNWLDYTMQNAKAKLELFKEYNIPIFVMEPLRGGKLVNLDDEYKTILKTQKDINAVEWAFRYLQSFEEVKVILSGMSNIEQLKENVQIFNTNEPLNNSEIELLYSVANKMTEKTSLPCTACRYCTPKCPKGLDIPRLIELYNDHAFAGGFIAPMVIDTLPEEKRPSACVSCRACEAVCPQSIKISEMMSDFTERLSKK